MVELEQLRDSSGGAGFSEVAGCTVRQEQCLGTCAQPRHRGLGPLF